MRKLALAIILLVLPQISFGLGFDLTYETRVGDYNNDGYIDIFIKKPSVFGWVPIKMAGLDIFIQNSSVTKPDVPAFVLMQNSSGKFSVSSSLTQSEIDTLSQWPRSNIEASIADFNVDGTLDLLLVDLASTIAGALDQLIYASPRPGQIPQGVISINSDLQQFILETSSWAKIYSELCS